MNYIQKDISQLLQDTKEATFLLNSKYFDNVNWLTLHCFKGPCGEFSSIEWIHFNNLEKHLKNIILPDTQIFETISDLEKWAPLPVIAQHCIKKSASFMLDNLSKAMHRMFMVSQTACDMDRHNKSFYANHISLIEEVAQEDYIHYSRTNVLYPKRHKDIKNKLLSTSIER